MIRFCLIGTRTPEASQDRPPLRKASLASGGGVHDQPAIDTTMAMKAHRLAATAVALLATFVAMPRVWAALGQLVLDRLGSLIYTLCFMLVTSTWPSPGFNPRASPLVPRLPPSFHEHAHMHTHPYMSPPSAPLKAPPHGDRVPFCL